MIFRLTLLILTCLLYSQGICQEIIPSWFEELPQSPAGIMFATGYAGKYSNQRLARRMAIYRGVKNLAKQKKIRLIFKVEELSDGRFRLLNPSFQEIFQEDVFNQVKSDFAVLDSAITEEGYFVLLGSPARKSIRLHSSRTKTWDKKPSWTESLPQSQKWLYGVGIVANYSSMVRAWEDADEYARFDLGKNLEIETESIHAIQRDNRYLIESKIYKQTYDIILKEAVITHRWYDTDQDIYYSLCRMPK